MTSDLPVVIHVASTRNVGLYEANTPDAYTARPVAGNSGEYFIAGHHLIIDHTAPM